MSPDAPRIPRLGPVRLGALLAWGAVVAVATLWPVRDGIPIPEELCLVCGANGGADAIRNVLLFLPLGILLAGTGLPRTTVVVLALLTSGSVEVLQWFIPGRHPSLGDLVFDASGALLGLTVPGLVARAARGPRAIRRRLGAAFLATALAGVAAPALLSLPMSPQNRMHVRLRPEFGHLDTLPGVVTSARVGGTALRDTILDPSSTLGRALRGDQPLEVAFTLAAPLSSRRETGLLRIHDDAGRDVLFLGLRPGVMIFRRLTWSDRLRLEHPAATRRVEATPARGPMQASVDPTESGLCLGWGAPEREEVCGVGPTPGSAWRWVVASPGLPGPAGAAVSVVWLLALVLPFGLTGPDRAGHVTATLALWIAMLAAAATDAVVGPPALELLAVPVGLALGSWARNALPRGIL